MRGQCDVCAPCLRRVRPTQSAHCGEVALHRGARARARFADDEWLAIEHRGRNVRERGQRMLRRRDYAERMRGERLDAKLELARRRAHYREVELVSREQFRERLA